MSRRRPRRAGVDHGARVLIVPETWATSGLCAVAPDAANRDEIFDLFDEPNIGPNAPVTARRERIAALRAVCHACPVLAQCRDFGMGQQWGFYGGLTPEERAARRHGDQRAHEAIVAEVRESERVRRAQRNGGVA